MAHMTALGWAAECTCHVVFGPCRPSHRKEGERELELYDFNRQGKRSCKQEEEEEVTIHSLSQPFRFRTGPGVPLAETRVKKNPAYPNSSLGAFLFKTRSNQPLTLNLKQPFMHYQPTPLTI